MCPLNLLAESVTHLASASVNGILSLCKNQCRMLIFKAGLLVSFQTLQRHNLRGAILLAILTSCCTELGFVNTYLCFHPTTFRAETVPLLLYYERAMDEIDK